MLAAGRAFWPFLQFPYKDITPQVNILPGYGATAAGFYAH